MKELLSVAFGQFLSQFLWDWFLSLTFRDEVTSFRAHRLFARFVSELEKAAGIPIFWFRADEIGPRGGRFHLHALIGNVAHLRRMSWIDRWGQLAGYARILPFDAQKGAAYYCTKYATKQNGDWDLSDNLLAFQQYQPALPLAGPTKLPPVSGAVTEESANMPRHRKTTKPASAQFPLVDAEQLEEPLLSDPVSEVYAAEVTRGRGRFRQFLFPARPPSK